jgi:RNA polymerase sigma-70 factor (sigma-E family)
MADRQGASLSGAWPERRVPTADAVLAELYASHWAGLVRLAVLLLRDRGRAEEVVQDAFIAAYPRLARLQEDGTALAYLRRSVVNGVRSVQRHRGVEQRYLSRASGRPDVVGRRSLESAEAMAVGHAADATLLQAVRGLPHRQYEVVVLRYYLDLSEHQIAEALDISTGSVKTHAHRALSTLRTTVGDAT